MSALHGTSATAYEQKTFDSASMNWTSWRTMPRDASISSISSRWAGASLRESPIAPTMISNNTPSTAARPSNISTKRANKRSCPYVIEPSAGADRSTLAFLVDAYHEEEVRGEKRVVLKFHPELAPIKIAVLPLLKKNDRIVETAKKLTADLGRRWYTVYDDTASIGRLYRRQDEVGTPFCVTVDVQTVGDEKAPADDKVTIRDRNTMEQVRVSLSALESTIGKLMDGKWAEVAQEHGITKTIALTVHGPGKNTTRGR